MTATEFLRNDAFDEKGELAIDELIKKEIVNQSCAATIQLKQVWQDNQGNEILKRLFLDLFGYITEYMVLIGQFNLLNRQREEKDELVRIDYARKIKHDALIDQIKIINRYLANRLSYQKSFIPKSINVGNRQSITVWAKEIYLDLAILKGNFN